MIEAYYYMFSLATFFIALVHVLNMTSVKLRGKVIVKTYLSETSKPKGTNTVHSKYYFMVYGGSLILFLVNLVYSIYVMLQDSDRQRAINALITISFVVVLVFVALILSTRSLYRKNRK